MILIALTALFMGTCTGFVLARRFLVRTLLGLIIALIALYLFAAWVPSDTLPGDDYLVLIVVYLFVPPMTAGLVGGAVIAWLLRTRAKKA